MNILVSIIIPTTGSRPKLLLRSIETALAGFKPNEVEVVVVPNGPEYLWKDAISSLYNTKEVVRICPLEKANVNAARNNGLTNARGVLVRFLDDDDFLISNIAVKQCYELLTDGADISSYAIRSEDEQGIFHQILRQPNIDDFVTAHFSLFNIQLPLAHVYRRSLIRNLLWNEDYKVCEDVAWMHTISSQSEVRWIKSDDVVGVWYHHVGPRLSYAHPSNLPSYLTAKSIFNTVKFLEEQGRMSIERRHAAVSGLWLCVHRGFYFNPLYWHKVAINLLQLAPDIRPKTFLFTLPGIGKINTLLLEWLILPVRWFIYAIQMIKAMVLGWNSVRRL